MHRLGLWVAHAIFLENRARTVTNSAMTLLFLMAVTLSAQGQITPSPPALIHSQASEPVSDSYPRIATGGDGHWVAVWTSDENLGGTAGVDDDIFVSTSSDNGATWSASALLNTNGTTDAGRDRSPRLTTDGDGHWLAVWESTENLGGTSGTDYDIFVATSSDNGATWSAPALLNTNGTTDAGGDYRPHITTDGAGHWVAAWYSYEDLGGTAGTDGDIFVANRATYLCRFDGRVLVKIGAPINIHMGVRTKK